MKYGQERNNQITFYGYAVRVCKPGAQGNYYTYYVIDLFCGSGGFAVRIKKVAE
jgi:tRNA/tmRNA/rRNA uracil-C5-methylase (TrmA/RlmC/RlmD family)